MYAGDENLTADDDAFGPFSPNPDDCTCTIDESRGVFDPDDDCPVHVLGDDA